MRSTECDTSRHIRWLLCVESGPQADVCWSTTSLGVAVYLISDDDAVHSSPTHAPFHPRRFAVRLAGFAGRISLGCAGYFDGDFAPGFGVSTCGLSKAELAGATFLSAFGFLASRLPRCLLPLPMIVHPTVVPPLYPPTVVRARLASGCAGASDRTPHGTLTQAPNARRRTPRNIRPRMSVTPSRTTSRIIKSVGQSGSFHVRARCTGHETRRLKVGSAPQ